MVFRTLFRKIFPSKQQQKQHSAEEEAAIRTAFTQRCTQFKRLLGANKEALEVMAELEETLTGERVYSMRYVRGRCTTVLAAVSRMVRNLNRLSDDKHTDLSDSLHTIQKNISNCVDPKLQRTEGTLVLPIAEAGTTGTLEVGSKMANLGEMYRKLGLLVPAGFVVTASGYRYFMEENGLTEEIQRRIQKAEIGDLDSIFSLSSSIQQLILSAPLPELLTQAIVKQYTKLCQDYGKNSLFAVRSSAIGEDGFQSSFAGQYLSELNVPVESLTDAYKAVVASKYGVTAMSYRLNRGIPDDDVAMCVGCLLMIDAKSGGVCYSRDPLDTDSPHTVIHAIPGLPKGVVDGTEDPDIFITEQENAEQPPTIIERQSYAEERKEQASFTLSDKQIIELATVARQLEQHYKGPQDIEWAYDQDTVLIILQSRPLPHTARTHETTEMPAQAEITATPIISGGTTAAPGCGAGRIVIVRRNADILSFPKGAVLVTELAHSRWAPLLSRTAAIITTKGGAAGHLASVAREYGVPALFGVKNLLQKMSALPEDMEITVDADKQRIYLGRQEALLQRKIPQKQCRMAGTPVHGALHCAAQHIVPLNLLDPEAANFSPEYCQTLHDITRYCHEKSVTAMFDPKVTVMPERAGKQLYYKGSKLQYWIINIDDGFTEPVQGKTVDLKQIASTPMLALWEGMIAVPWAGPPIPSAKDFLSLVARSAANPELEITQKSVRLQRNYLLISKDYCNLQASFGYHFCTVEAHAGENNQENYINFHFKGGAANLSKRTARVDVLADIFATRGFIVDVKEDALFARVEDLPLHEACNKLRIVGHLLIHSRQTDASLGDIESIRRLHTFLEKGIQKVPLLPTPEKQEKQNRKQKNTLLPEQHKHNTPKPRLSS